MLLAFSQLTCRPTCQSKKIRPFFQYKYRSPDHESHSIIDHHTNPPYKNFSSLSSKKMSSNDHCITCKQPVRPRQEGLQCDGCHKCVHECPVGEFPVTYKIVEQGSKRGKVKLIDSNGYTHNIKSRGVNVVYWQCSVRPKVNPCKALVIERGGSFQSNSTSHNHQPAVGAATASEIMVAVKAEAMKDLFKPAPAIVNEVI